MTTAMSVITGSDGVGRYRSRLTWRTSVSCVRTATRSLTPGARNRPA